MHVICSEHASPLAWICLRYNQTPGRRPSRLRTASCGSDLDDHPSSDPGGGHAKNYTRLQMPKKKIQANTLGCGHPAFGKLSSNASQRMRDGPTERSGRLPVNLSGRLKAKGPAGRATGISMHVIAARLLSGDTGDMQIPGAELGARFNMGGGAVTNYVSILEPIKL